MDHACLGHTDTTTEITVIVNEGSSNRPYLANAGRCNSSFPARVQPRVLYSNERKCNDDP